MIKRPRSITIIGMICVIGGALTIASYFINQTNPVYLKLLEKGSVSPSVHFFYMAISGIVTFISGIGMFWRKNWSRYLYAGMAVFGVIFSLLTSPVKSMALLSILLYAIVFFFLFRKTANEYFTGQSDRSE